MTSSKKSLVVSTITMTSLLLLVACGGGGDSSSGGSEVFTGQCIEERPIEQVQGTSDFFNVCDFPINVAFVFGEGLVGESELDPGDKTFGLSSNQTRPIACRPPSMPLFEDGRAYCS